MFLCECDGSLSYHHKWCRKYLRRWDFFHCYRILDSIQWCSIQASLLWGIIQMQPRVQKRFAVKAPHDNTPAHVAVETGWGGGDMWCECLCCLQAPVRRNALSLPPTHTDTPKAVNFPIWRPVKIIPIHQELPCEKKYSLQKSREHSQEIEELFGKRGEESGMEDDHKLTTQNHTLQQPQITITQQTEHTFEWQDYFL